MDHKKIQQYSVTGMSCAACSARVEKAVSAVPGVTSCAVSLLTNSMGVEGDASPDAVMEAVRKAGYGAAPKGTEAPRPDTAAADDPLADRETPRLVRRLCWSVGFLLVLLYISMGHMMWGFPLPARLADNHIGLGLIQLLLTGVIMLINRKFFISGFRALAHRAPNMDTLVALGSSVAFLWSVFALFAMTDAVTRGDHAAAHDWMMQFYFESAAMILTLITVGKTLEARSKGKTTDALRSLMKLSPKTATLLQDGREVTVPVEQVAAGDIFVVRPGESIPVDGRVESGSGAVNEAALTGESLPTDKAAGDSVSAGTINQSGFLTCRATRVGQDTTLSQIIRMVGDAAATKAPIAKIADRVSGVFVPVVMGISLVTFLAWMLIRQDVGFALARGISVLVISCPCALGLATPVAIMVGSGVGARGGILFKTAAALEEAGRIRTVVLDKTGTVTKGTPRVMDILPFGVSEEQLLTAALSLERGSEHPLARAVCEEAARRRLDAPAPVDFRALPGHGLAAATPDGELLLGGNLALMRDRLGNALTPAEWADYTARAEALADEGKTPLFFARGGRLLGIISVADEIKPESPAAIRALRDMGLEVVMLTGDTARTARAVGRQAGLDEAHVIAGVLPDGKEQVVRDLARRGKVAMVGDGINDAPALTRADLGMAIGAGTDVAIDAADVVLVNSRLSDVPAAVRLGRATLRNIHENLFWAFFYNVICIPIAAGVLIPFGVTLDPMFGAAAMSLSSFCVVTNALRLNLCRIRGKEKPEPAAVPQSVPAPAPATSAPATLLHIEGMMCAHCEATVREALCRLPGVAGAEVSHTAGTARVTFTDAPLPDGALSAAVEAEDYRVTSVEHTE